MRSGLCKKGKGDLPDRVLPLFNRLGSSRENRRDREITLNLSMAATGREPDREITLDLNHLWIHRGVLSSW